MKMWEMLQAAYDFWRPNKYGIKPYLCKDGRKHPVAIICPGGAYSMVCSFVEGMPIAKALNNADITQLLHITGQRRKPASQILTRI